MAPQHSRQRTTTYGFRFGGRWYEIQISRVAFVYTARMAEVDHGNGHVFHTVEAEIVAHGEAIALERAKDYLRRHVGTEGEPFVPLPRLAPRWQADA